MKIENKVIVVTGGASGIGLALTKAFLARDIKAVYALDIDEGKLQSLRAWGTELRGKFAGIRVDVTDESSYRSALNEIEESEGSVDILCSNAGIARSGGVETPNQLWNESFQVNVMAHVYGSRAVLNGMIEKGEGYLVYTASAAGLLTNLGAAPYSVTKHAAVALAEWMAITYGPLGIRVSCLAPQGVNTQMLFPEEPGTTTSKESISQTAVLAFGEVLEPEFVAARVLEGIEKEEFLILPHPQVRKYLANKVTDYDRWIRTMSKVNRALSS